MAGDVELAAWDTGSVRLDNSRVGLLTFNLLEQHGNIVVVKR